MSVDVIERAKEHFGRLLELQLARDLAQSLQGLFGFAPPAQDHEIVGIAHDARAKASLQPELLPSQHQPTHIQIRQQR